MNSVMVKHLILKDFYLHRWLILGAIAGGLVSLAIICTGSNAGFLLGVVLLLTVLIAAGSQIIITTTVMERKEQTLAFVMSLPVSYREYTFAKIAGNLAIFLLPWLILLIGSLGVLLISPKAQGLIPFTAIMAVEILLSTCVVAGVALVTESQGWTIAAIMVGNIALNGIGYFVAHIGSIARNMGGASVRWTPAAFGLLAGEFGLIGLVIGLTFYLQSRKKDFL